MDAATRAAFVAHVRKLESLSINCEEEERKEDAVRSLACMALLAEGFRPSDPDGGCEVVDLMPYLRLVA